MSIRDICARVGIRRARSHYHFTSKQAIFDELLARFESSAAEMMALLESALDEGARPDAAGLMSVCGHFFDGYLMEPFCNGVLRLLTIEQFSSLKARSLYRRWMFDEPLAYQTRLFAALTNRADASYLAVKFYSPIYLVRAALAALRPALRRRQAAFRADAYRHVRRFFAELEVRNG